MLLINPFFASDNMWYFLSVAPMLAEHHQRDLRVGKRGHSSPSPAHYRQPHPTQPNRRGGHLWVWIAGVDDGHGPGGWGWTGQEGGPTRTQSRKQTQANRPQSRLRRRGRGMNNFLSSLYLTSRGMIEYLFYVFPVWTETWCDCVPFFVVTLNFILFPFSIDYVAALILCISS